MKLRRQGAVGAAIAVACLVGLGTGRGPAPATAAGPDPSSMTRRPPRTSGQSCVACHVFDPTFSHPVDIFPDLEVPSHLPLASGRMTCVTCHDGSDGGGAHGRLRGTAPGLCRQCHTSTSRTAGDVHPLGLSFAHFPVNDPQRSRGRTGALDAETTGCLGCHDDLLAQGIPDEPIGSPFRRRGHDSHPIATPYRRTGAPDPYDGLRHPDLVDSRIRLFDGNLGCGSCHSVYAREPGLLVMQNDRSRLCTSCHDM